MAGSLSLDTTRSTNEHEASLYSAAAITNESFKSNQRVSESNLNQSVLTIAVRLAGDVICDDLRPDTRSRRFISLLFPWLYTYLETKQPKSQQESNAKHKQARHVLDNQRNQFP